MTYRGVTKYNYHVPKYEIYSTFVYVGRNKTNESLALSSNTCVVYELVPQLGTLHLRM